MQGCPLNEFVEIVESKGEGLVLFGNFRKMEPFDYGKHFEQNKEDLMEP